MEGGESKGISSTRDGKNATTDGTALGEQQRIHGAHGPGLKEDGGSTVAGRNPSAKSVRDAMVASSQETLDLDAMLNRRRGLLSVFTRYANELESLTSGKDDRALMLNYSEKIHDSFDKYMRAHDYVIQFLKLEKGAAHSELIDSLEIRHAVVCDRLQYLELSYFESEICKGQSRSQLPDDFRDDRSAQSKSTKRSRSSAASIRKAALALQKAKAIAEIDRARADLKVRLAEMDFRFAQEEDDAMISLTNDMRSFHTVDSWRPTVQSDLGTQTKTVNAEKLTETSRLHDTQNHREKKVSEHYDRTSSVEMKIPQVDAPIEETHRSSHESAAPMREIDDTLHKDDAKGRIEDWVRDVRPTTLNVNAPEWIHNSATAAPRYMDSMMLCQPYLPRPEIMTFDGKLTSYTAFMANFSTYIGNQPMPASYKLGYLVQFCTGEAKEAIQDCHAEPDPEKGYFEALRILKDQFGRTHEVARSHLSELINGPSIQLSDGTALAQLSRKMNSCSIALTGSDYAQNLNSEETLRQIVKRLPKPLRVKWVERAAAILNSNYLNPTFEDLMRFVQERARVASCPFADTIEKEKKGQSKTPEDKKTKAVFTTTVKNTENCIACDGSHPLHKCKIFIAMSKSERFEAVKKANLCFNCFHEGHSYKKCPKKSYCREGCKSKHSSLLHREQQETQHRASQEIKTRMPQETQAEGYAGSTGNPSSAGISLQVLNAIIKDREGRPHQVKVLLDQGSNVTLCTEDLVKDLHLSGKPSDIKINTISGSSAYHSREYDMEITSMDADCTLQLRKVFSMKNLPCVSATIPDARGIRKWPHLKDVEIPKYTQNDISLLIGVDHPDAFKIRDIREGESGSPYAVKYPLGWTIIGPLTEAERKNHHTHFIVADSQSLEEQMSKLWSSDFKDVPSSRLAMSIDDEKALKIMTDTAHLDQDNHWTIRLPWKTDPPPLENNRLLAENRLKYLQRKFKKNQAYQNGYVQKLNTYIENGFAKRVSPDDDESKIPKYYLPHHGVVHPQKKTLRVVFDCSAKYNGISLNDCLLQGPDHLNSLIGVLLRFREDQIALSSDVEAMFHQVRVAKCDQNALRFLWFADGDVAKSVVEYKMSVHLFGATSSPSVCCFALRMTAEYFKDSCSKLAFNAINRNFYMDDLLKSVASKKIAMNLITELSSILSKGGFRLTKWMCNETEVLEHIPLCERAKGLKDLEGTVERTLGVTWNVDEDSFYFRIEVQEKPMTRRGILSEVASYYDPCGFAAPAILAAKRLLQEMSVRECHWDDELPEDLKVRWVQWKTAMKCLKNERIPRRFSQNSQEVIERQVHVFSDASEVGYSAVAYLRQRDAAGTIQVVFLMGKSRLAPVKTVSIPRLELSGATLSTQVALFICEELGFQLDKVFYWTDSMTVLRYLHNTQKRFKVFVANRLSAIREVSAAEQWRYVPSSENAADVGSRPVLPGSDQLRPWIEGPAFLRTDDWPRTPALGNIPVEDKELKTYSRTLLHTVAGTEGTDNDNDNIDKDNRKDDDILDDIIIKYSSWSKVLRVTAWILRVISRFHGKKNPDRYLTLTELQEAEKRLIRNEQSKFFSEELMQLKNGKNIGKRDPNRLRQFNPILLDGVMCVGGRLERATYLSSSAMHPVILPPESALSALLVRHTHILCGHCGVDHTLFQLRKKYWILKGKSLVKKLLRSPKGGCVVCKRYHTRLREQQMADLPASRVQPMKRPFSEVGIDYFGPLYVSFRRGKAKRYGCIFTCMSSRAVHIEIAHTLDTDSFLAAFQRFVARRGKPSRVFSDNGTNLVAGAKELKECIRSWNESQINDTMLQKEIEWKFNPPTASHFGGVWERLIRSTRTILQKILQEQVVRDEALLTIVTEVEKILNDRPLWSPSDDPEDDAPLTPSQILLLEPNSCIPVGRFDKDCYYRRWWRQANHLANIFWKRWTQEYLSMLQKRQKWTRPVANLKVGDIVLVADSNTSRGQWPLGKIVKTYPDDCGLTRTVDVKTASSVLKRPIHKLCLLESA